MNQQQQQPRSQSQSRQGGDGIDVSRSIMSFGRPAAASKRARSKSPDSDGARNDAPRAPNVFAPGLSPRQISAKITKTQTLGELCSLLESAGTFASFDMANVSTALSRLGKRVAEAREQADGLPSNLCIIFTSLVDRALVLVNAISETDMSALFHGVANGGFFEGALRETARKLFVALTKEFKTRYSLEAFEPQQCSNICWAMAKVAFRDADLFNRIAKRCDDAALAQFDAHELAILAWSFATAQVHGDDDWFPRLGRACVHGLGAMSPQNLGNVAWAFASLHVMDAALMRGLSAEVAKRNLATFPGQAFSQIAWAYATLDVRDAAVFNGLAQFWMDNGSLARFTPLELASVAWSFATARVSNAQVMRTIGDEMLRRGLADFLPQHLAMAAWSMATLGNPAPSLLDAIGVDCARRGFADFPLHSLTVITWAFSSLGLLPADFFKLLGAELVRMDQLKESARCLGHLALALAAVGYVNPALYGKLAAQCAKFNLAATGDADLANLAWAFACADALQEKPVLELLSSPRAGDRTPRATDKDVDVIARQTLDCMAAWTLGGGQGALPAVLQLFATEAWHDVRRLASQSQSVEHAALKADLVALGYDVRSNVVTPEHVLLELVVQPAKSGGGGGGEVAVELYGAEYFMANGLTPNGRHKFRQRLLKGAGRKAKVLQLSAWKAHVDAGARRDWLAKEMKMLGEIFN